MKAISLILYISFVNGAFCQSYSKEGETVPCVKSFSQKCDEFYTCNLDLKSNCDGIVTLDLREQIGIDVKKLRKFKNVKYLSIIDCKKDSFPKEISEMDSLKILLVGSNNFKEVPVEVFSLTQLNSLNLSNNSISLLPSQIAHSSLTSIYLNENPFPNFPMVLGEVETLEVIGISKDQFSQEEIEDFRKKYPDIYLDVW